MEFDVRNNEEPKINRIRVAEINRNFNSVEVIEQGFSTGRIKLTDTDSGVSISVNDKAHAENVIKGLQKAIELGWLA